MDNTDINKKYSSENSDDFTPIHNTAPIPFDDDITSKANVSHSPLNLNITKKQSGTPTIKKETTEKVASTERITRVKTFFVKLHTGSIDFLDEQIGKWLKNNPDVAIKQTNITTGMVVGKKTEPNIIVTVWY